MIEGKRLILRPPILAPVSHDCVMTAQWMGGSGCQTGFRGTQGFRRGESGVPRDENV